MEFGPAICLEFGIKTARNTLYTIEHIKGINNYIPDFLSREHFQNLCLLIFVQLRNGVETILNIPDSLSWESYVAEWVPHWELRNTKILSPTTHLSYSNTVPEVRGRRVSNVPARRISRTNENAVEAQNALTKLFHDIILVWDIRDNIGHNQQYFCASKLQAF